MLDCKITIGIVARESIKTRTVYSLCAMLKDFPYDYDICFKDGGSLHGNREAIAQFAIDNGSSHLLFIDSDMAFDRDAVLRLVERNKDVIGADYNHRRLPLVGTARNKVENDGIVECESVATGFMLIKTDVLKKMPHPWFFWKYNDKGEVTMAEDYWFCEKAREAGASIWVDNTLSVKHIGEFLY